MSNEITLEHLLNALRSEHASVRLQAVESLSTRDGERVVPALITMLNDEHDAVRIAAIEGLGTSRDPHALPFLLETFNSGSGNIEVRKTIIKALSKLGQIAIPDLVNILKDFIDDEWVGVPTVHALAQTGDERALRELLSALHSAIYEIRQSAAEELAAIGEPALIPLLQVLKEGKEPASWHVMHALIRLGEPAVLPLIELLENGPVPVRQYAAEALGRIGDRRALEALFHSLEDRDVQMWAALALGWPGEAASIEYLLNALNVRDRHLYLYAIGALAGIGEPALAPLVQTMQNNEKHSFTRANAARALGKLGGRAVLTPLLQALEDEDVQVRQAAVEALGELGDSAAVDPLLRALTDTSDNVRRSAISTLSQLGDERAIVPLIGVLNNRSEKTIMRLLAAHALGRIGDERAIEPLFNVLQGNDYAILHGAAYALSSLGESGFQLLLRSLENEDSGIRTAAINALTHFQGQKVLELFMNALHDPERQVRQQAAHALGRFKDEQVFTLLLQALYDEDDTVRLYAAQSLGQLGDERAIPALMELWENTGESVQPGELRNVCLRAIKRIKGW